jgi:hypothetical protein
VPNESVFAVVSCHNPDRHGKKRQTAGRWTGANRFRRFRTLSGRHDDYWRTRSKKRTV